MKIKQEDKALAEDILGYMLEYGKALTNKETTKINFIKNNIQMKIENLSVESLNTILKFIDAVYSELDSSKDISDKKLRIKGIENIRDIVDVEINDKELNQAAATQSNKAFYDSLAQEMYDCASELDSLADLTKARKINPEIATERVIEQVERKVQFVEHEVERLAAELPQTITVSGATVKPKGVEKAPQVESQGFRSSRAYKASPFAGEVPKDLFSESEKSVESLQNSLKDVKESIEESSDKSASSKPQLSRLDKLSARLSIIGAYLKSFKEHLNPLKARPLGITIPLKHRVETKLRDLIKTEKNPVKKEVFQNSLKKLTEPKVKKAKVAENKSGLFSKKSSGSKRKPVHEIDLLEKTDELQEKKKTQKSRRGGRRGSMGTL